MFHNIYAVPKSVYVWRENLFHTNLGNHGQIIVEELWYAEVNSSCSNNWNQSCKQSKLLTSSSASVQ